MHIVNPVSRPIVGAKLKNAAANAFVIAGIPLTQPVHPLKNLGLRATVAQLGQPGIQW
jgi:hypothetical protein